MISKNFNSVSRLARWKYKRKDRYRRYILRILTHVQERDRKKRAQCAAQDPGRELGWHAAPLPLSPSHTTHSDTGYTKISGLTAKIFHCSQPQPHSSTESCVGSHIRVRKYHPCKYISNLSNYFYWVDTLWINWKEVHSSVEVHSNCTTFFGERWTFIPSIL